MIWGNGQGKLLKLNRKTIIYSLRTIFFAGLVIFLLTIFALAEGVGYTKEFNLIRVDYSSQDRSTVANCLINMNMSFNPIFFPLTYQIEQGRISGTFDATYVLPVRQAVATANFRELIEYVTVNSLVWHETVRNLPWLFVFGAALGFVVEKVIEKLED